MTFPSAIDIDIQAVMMVIPKRIKQFNHDIACGKAVKYAYLPGLPDLLFPAQQTWVYSKPHRYIDLNPLQDMLHGYCACWSHSSNAIQHLMQQQPMTIQQGQAPSTAFSSTPL